MTSSSSRFSAKPRFSQGRQQQQQHYNNNNRMQGPGKPNEDFDFKRLEALMECMTKSVNSLVGRVSLLEKGPPSHEPVALAGPAEVPREPPNPWILPTASRAGPSARPDSLSSSVQPLMPPNWTPSATKQAPQATASRPPPKQASTSNASTVTPSLNPDFPKICKSLYYACQIRRHMQNWTNLPASIQRNLKHLANNIKPIHPSAELMEDISSLFTRIGDEVRERVTRHFSERLDQNLSILRESNPLDKDQVIEVVIKQITYRLGGKAKAMNVRALVEGEAKGIWCASGEDKVIGGKGKATVVDDIFRVPTHAAKKPCLKSTPPASTFNSYSVLADMDEETVEPDFPSLSRSSSHTNLKASSSHTDLKSSSSHTNLKPSSSHTNLKSSSFHTNLKSSTSSHSPITCDLADSPSPRRRKSSIPLPKLPSSSPKTPVSFIPLNHFLSSSTTKTNPNTNPKPNSTLPLTQPKSDSSTTVIASEPTPASLSPPSSAASSIPPRYKHHFGGVNKASWRIHLRPDTRTLIISDSNCRYLSEPDIPCFTQLECFSGANFTNTLDLVSRLPSGQLDNLVFAIGINHKEDDFQTRTVPAMKSFFETCRPKALRCIAVGVSINPCLPEPWIENLTEINLKLHQLSSNLYIKPLSSQLINTTKDMIHYTRETQLLILNKTMEWVNEHTKN